MIGSWFLIQKEKERKKKKNRDSRTGTKSIQGKPGAL